MLSEKELLAQPEEAYMGPEQIEFFRHRLQEKRRVLLERKHVIQAECQAATATADIVDAASDEEERKMAINMLALCDAELRKIAKALNEMDDGEYGYCLETGEPIGLKRLLTVPESLYSMETARMHEQRASHTRAWAA